jgi:hypothetical protein
MGKTGSARSVRISVVTADLSRRTVFLPTCRSAGFLRCAKTPAASIAGRIMLQFLLPISAPLATHARLSFHIGKTTRTKPICARKIDPFVV